MDDIKLPRITLNGNEEKEHTNVVDGKDSITYFIIIMTHLSG